MIVDDTGEIANVGTLNATYVQVRSAIVICYGGPLRHVITSSNPGDMFGGQGASHNGAGQDSVITFSKARTISN